MPTKTFYRLLVDISMPLLTTLLMADTLAGNQLHELLGVLFFVLFSLHQSLTLKWFQCLLNGKYAPRRLVNTAITALATSTPPANQAPEKVPEFKVLMQEMGMPACLQDIGVAPSEENLLLLKKGLLESPYINPQTPETIARLTEALQCLV